MEDTPVCPRPEYPRPQLMRENWLCLNGQWTYQFDFGQSGKDRGLQLSNGFEEKIIVPFCPESELSGVAFRDFIENMWYHRTFHVPAEWADYRLMLHFGAVDYEAEVYVDGMFVGRHFGGSSSFSFDITSVTMPGNEHDLVVHVIDNHRTGEQASGKQAIDYASAGCLYTRVTGIWQSVWLEPVPFFFLDSFQVLCGPRNGGPMLSIIPSFNTSSRAHKFRVTLREEGRDSVVSSVTGPLLHGVPVPIDLDNPRLWSPVDPYLYQLTLEVLDSDSKQVDVVQSYAGVRWTHVEGNQVFLNDEAIYLRLVLDQGYYAEGVWTAPSDEALRRDIELGLAAGFNGARLHQKVFEERYHYWADRLGYLTWGESASWGMDLRKDAAARNFLNEWREIVIRDRNHPSIIAWTVLNETWDLTDRKRHHRLHWNAYDETRALDPTRPINGASGGCQVKTDLYCVHIYEQDPILLRDALRPGPDGKVYRTLGDQEVPYEGQPYIVDEFGGIRWISDPLRMETLSWGYGKDPHSMEEFYNRLEGQVLALLSLENVSGFCYTQLTDVEQEQNGIYHYDRSPKFSMERIKDIIQREEADDEDHLTSLSLLLKS